MNNNDNQNKNFECSLLLISNLPEIGFKLGRYSNSNHTDIKSYMVNKWVVLAYIDFDWIKSKEVGFTEENIYRGCISFLNGLKEFENKLEPYKAEFKKKNNKPIIISQIIINEYNNKNFWGKGKTYRERLTKNGKRLGRPKKK